MSGGRPEEGRKIVDEREKVVRKVLGLGRRRDDRASKLPLLVLVVAVGDGMRVRARVSGCRGDESHSDVELSGGSGVVSGDAG